MSKHTPTPWGVPDGGTQPTITTADESKHIATMADTGDEMEANAAFIVRAVNCHEALVAALKGLVERGTDSPVHLAAEAALRAAGVEP